MDPNRVKNNFLDETGPLRLAPKLPYKSSVPASKIRNAVRNAFAKRGVERKVTPKIVEFKAGETVIVGRQIGVTNSISLPAIPVGTIVKIKKVTHILPIQTSDFSSQTQRESVGHTQHLEICLPRPFWRTFFVNKNKSIRLFRIAKKCVQKTIVISGWYLRKLG